MTVALIYQSRHGHTRRICERVAESLRERGVDSEVLDVQSLSDSFALGNYDAAILAGPVYYGRHPRALARFAQTHRDELDGLPSAWLSVSLAASDAKGVEEARETASRFPERAGWHPNVTLPVAGSLSYRRYNPLLRLLMRQIARVSGASTDTSHDHDYTDWGQVDALAARIGEALHGGFERQPPPEAPH